MRIGLIGTGAISHKHAQAYQNIGFRVTVCTNRSEESGRRFASQYGAQFVPTYEEVCWLHQVDLIRWLAGPVQQVSADWQLGAIHSIESEDVVNAILCFQSGATGVVRAATAFWPGYTERIEIHGTHGSTIVASGKLITWDVQHDRGDPAPPGAEDTSGASNPMEVSVVPLERQFMNFADSIRNGRKPLVSGEQGLAALQIVKAIYDACRTGQRIVLGN